MSGISCVPTKTFAPPFRNIYPFDPVCNQIVSELKARQWMAEGITVNFSEGTTHYQALQIAGETFSLYFSKNQQGGVAAIINPTKHVEVFEDGSVQIFSFIGAEGARQQFMKREKTSDDDPEIYKLEEQSYGERKVSDETNTPSKIPQVFKEITDWLRKNVLETIRSCKNPKDRN